MRDPRPARLNLRLAPQLRDALSASATEAGCSLNAFAVQVLAAAAGHRARFRGTPETGPTREERSVELRELTRDYRGFPLGITERYRHIAARDAFIQEKQHEMPFAEVMKLVAQLDQDDPAMFVERLEMLEIA